MRKSQTSVVLDYLKNHGTLTSMEAFEMFGATRLAGIIYTLRRKGHDIETIDCVGKNRYGGVCIFAKYKYHGQRYKV